MSNLKRARPDHPISEPIASRWSPYVFDSRPVAREDLLSLFEAARWAPSSYNEQPWRYIVATQDEPEVYKRVLSCLVDANQAWAKKAPVLALGVVSRRFERNGKPNPAAHHDLGSASAHLTLEATQRGLFVHQMGGILPERAADLFEVPEGFQVLTALAIGYRGQAQVGEEKLGSRDQAARSRRPLAEFVFTGRWERPFTEQA